LHFNDVFGRKNDNLILPDGTEVHSATVTHAVRAKSEVLAYQFHQYSDRMELHLVVRINTIPDVMKKRIVDRLTRVHRDFDKLSFNSVPDLATTSAGKRRWVVRHKE
jgi:phenylacetate-coenzyme A ligase PaaK-like adenylate-forming protein